MICRLCLTKLSLENNVPLFNEFDSDDAPHLLAIIAKYLHVNITWDDEISTTICSECSKHLSEFEKYCVFIMEQQLKLIQKVAIDYQNADPMREKIKLELDEDIVKQEMHVQPEENIVTMETYIKSKPGNDIVTKEMQVQTESDEVIDTNEILLQSVRDENIVTKDIQVQCEADEVIFTKVMLIQSLPDEDIVTKEMPLPCEPNEVFVTKEMQLIGGEPQKTVATEMDLDLNTHSLPESSVICSAVSSNSAPASSSNFHQAYADFIEDSSMSWSGDSVKRVRPTSDATWIKHLLPLQNIYQSYLMGNPLDIYDRMIIAKSVLDEYLRKTSAKVLVRKDFERLAENIKEVFPSELLSTYYIPSTGNKKVSGKLWIVYNSSIRPKRCKTDFSAKKIEIQKKKMPKWSAERWREYRARIEVYTKNLKQLRNKKN